MENTFKSKSYELMVSITIEKIKQSFTPSIKQWIVTNRHANKSGDFYWIKICPNHIHLKEGNIRKLTREDYWLEEKKIIFKGYPISKEMLTRLCLMLDQAAQDVQSKKAALLRK